MTQTANVVGLFQGDVSGILQELESSGFAREDIQLITNNSRNAPGHLVSWIADLGAPEDDARFYAQAVQSGGTLLVLQTTEDRASEATLLFHRSGALRRNDREGVEPQPPARLTTFADLAPFEEGTIEITETAEQAVVTTRARVVEEIVLGKEMSERTETIHDTVRRTLVDVERWEPEGTGGEPFEHTSGVTRSPA